MPKSARERKPPLSVAFAGTGSTNVEKKNVEALLDDLIKGRQFFGLIPEPGPKRGDKGLRNVWSWLDETDQQYDQEPLNAMLLKLGEFKADGDEVLLVLAWNEEGETEEVETLMAEAIEAGIKVKDLCRALDDLEFDDSEDDPAEDSEEDTLPFEPDPPKRGKARQQGRSKSAGKPEPVDEAQAETATNVAAQQVSFVSDDDALLVALHNYVVRILTEDFGLTPKTQPKVAVFYNDDEDEYRLAAKGRPRRGEKRMEIEHDEAVKLGLVD